MDLKSNLVKDEKKKGLQDQNFKKLEKMDEYCNKEYIFFTERDRVQRMIKNSQGQFNNFRGHLNKALSHIDDIPEHPNLEKLLTGGKEDFPSLNWNQVKSKTENKEKCNCKSMDARHNKSFHKNVREMVQMDCKNGNKIQSEFEQIQKMLDDRNFQVSEIVKKSRKRRANPVSNLSSALN